MCGTLERENGCLPMTGRRLEVPDTTPDVGLESIVVGSAVFKACSLDYRSELLKTFTGNRVEQRGRHHDPCFQGLLRLYEPLGAFSNRHSSQERFVKALLHKKHVANRELECHVEPLGHEGCRPLQEVEGRGGVPPVKRAPPCRLEVTGRRLCDGPARLVEWAELAPVADGLLEVVADDLVELDEVRGGR